MLSVSCRIILRFLFPLTLFLLFTLRFLRVRIFRRHRICRIHRVPLRFRLFLLWVHIPEIQILRPKLGLRFLLLRRRKLLLFYLFLLLLLYLLQIFAAPSFAVVSLEYGKQNDQNKSRYTNHHINQRMAYAASRFLFAR